jgi:hypothetical protein
MLDFIMQPQVLGVLALVVVFVIGLWGKRFLNHFRVIFQVWHLVEKMGILAGLKGYEKLALAMDVFQDKFYEEFGKEPKPGDEGWAVKVLTWLCKLENKDDVEDFFEQPSEPSNSETLSEGTA